MARHYHVTETTPGYLPDSEPATFTNRKRAVSYAFSLVRELREDDYKVTGRDGDYYGETYAGDLGRAIETIECFEDDCGSEAE